MTFARYIGIDYSEAKTPTAGCALLRGGTWIEKTTPYTHRAGDIGMGGEGEHCH